MKMQERIKYQEPPRTAMEVFHLLPEGTLCEIIENQLYMSPAPNRKHQKLSWVIVKAIGEYIEKEKLGEIYYAPIDVFIQPGRNTFQPDIVFVSTENASLLSDRGIEGAPDLVVEILSEGNKQHDTVKKKAVYERCGVKELWYVDPMKRYTYGFILEKGKYRAIGKPSKMLTLRSFNLTITLQEIL